MAVAVGCSHYQDDDIADLRFAHRDALRMRDMFVAALDVPSDAIFTFADGLDDSLPTRQNVLHALNRLATHTSEPIERLFFFFSGHGFSTPNGNDYLITRDSLTAIPEETSLRFDSLVWMLRATGAEHVVLLLDACRSAVAGGRALFPTRSKVDVKRLCPPGMVSFCSCAPETSSYESDRLESGIFSQALYEAFGDEGHCVTVGQLDTYLTDRVPSLALQYEKPLQRPHSRVEPAALVDLELVSPRKRNAWRASVSVGEEIRHGSVTRVNAEIAEPALFAVDFGTTTSVIAVPDTDGMVHLLPAGDGRKLVPSVITFLPDFNYLVGSPAVELEHFSAGRTVRAVKRHLGTDYTFPVDGSELSPELLASLVIRNLRANAEDALGRLPQEAVVAYPANFSMRQANSLLRAFELAGLHVARMVAEPSVAAYVVAVDRPSWEGHALVVDLGGGTLDVAVVEVGDNVIEVKSVYGDNHLGGLDFDTALAARLKQRLLEWNSAVVVDTAMEVRILQEAERAKQLLTTHHSVVVAIQDIEIGSQVVSHHFTLDRAEFREVCEELTARFAYIARVAIDDVDDHPAPIDVILLTGQGGKTFTVREALERLLPDTEFIDLYQEFAVCHGLAMQAGILKGAVRDLLLLDMSQRGIGILATPMPGKGHEKAGAPDYPFETRKAPGESTNTFVLYDRLTSIPTKSTGHFLFQGDPGADIAIPVIEKSKTSAEDVEILTITLPAPQKSVHVQLTAQFELSGLITLDVADLTNRTYRRYLLNRRLQNQLGEQDVGGVDLILDGWAVHDVESAVPSSSPGQPRADGAPRTIADLDIPENLAKLDEELLGRDDEGPLPLHRRADTLHRKARLHFFAGQREDALRALTDAVRTRVACTKQADIAALGDVWESLIRDLELAHQELEHDPALAKVRIAVTGLLLLDWRTGGKPGQLRTQVSQALDRIGAHEEARHIESLLV
ncbi:Hsp70 family protein [Streptomyces sp. NPDC008092]|uniref:Hsp70 family protein n=1 Tax=Streptomyces sp. NPDC008092 TaxID=3364808 RepID=UPI0036EC9BC4